MRLTDRHGQELDADFDLEPKPYGVDVILHSRSGGSNVGRGRNTAYFSVLEELLRRLSEIAATILCISVDSTVAQRLTEDQRRIQLTYPLRLSPDIDALALRVRITEGQRTVASGIAQGEPGGNKHKRIRLAVDLDGTGVGISDLSRVLVTTGHKILQKHAMGLPYRMAMPDPSVRPADLFTYDPSARERALAGHANVQNSLAIFLRDHGHDPLRRAPYEPDYDIAWVADTVVVAEVKTLPAADPAQQLRLGLGQVLHYRRALRDLYGDAAAVLAVEHEPPSPWIEVCADADVIISWPPIWPRLPLQSEQQAVTESELC